MAIQSPSLTYEDLARLRETRDERLELIDGELFVTPSPSTIHQRVSRRLQRLLDEAIIDTGIGEYFDAPYDVKLDDGSIVQPDFVAVLDDRSSLVAAGGIEGVPDFVVEIVSPSSKTHDRVRKHNLFARHSVREYWIVDPEAHAITIFSNPRNGRYQDETVSANVAVSRSIPGLEVELAPLFAPMVRD